MANKYDLKTWVKLDLTTATGANGTNIGSGVVPDGKNRFLTYIRVQRSGEAVASGAVDSQMIGIASVGTSNTTAASALSASFLIAPIHLPAAGASMLAGAVPAFVQEIRGSIENPILSVGGGGFMGIMGSLTAGKTVNVFAQYYDE